MRCIGACPTRGPARVHLAHHRRRDRGPIHWACIIDNAPVAELHLAARIVGDIRFVRHQHNCQAARIQFLQNSNDLHAGMAIQVARWLICQEQGWRRDQRARDRHALLLAAGQFRRAMACPGFQSYDRQSLLRAPQSLGPRSI